jgi:hypothetical protein
MSRKWPTLYIKTKTGAIQFWTIEAKIGPFLETEQGLVVTTFGQLDTDKPQVATDVISEGKSKGKKNATTPYEQAVKEADSKWLKQKKLGYVETVAGAQNDERDAIIEGGADPMLAYRYMDRIEDLRTGKITYEITKHAKKIKYPAFAQPKFDGIRSESDVNDETIWSRTRKPIMSVPHIMEQLKQLTARLTGFDSLIDGELYNHAYKAAFEKIASAVGQDEPNADSHLVQLHVYDLINEGNSETRQAVLDVIFKNGDTEHIKRVETVIVHSHEEFVAYFEDCVRRGYEGAMIRNMKGKYIGDRSYDLQKAKPFQDDEFEIVGFTEGAGKLRGHLGTWICKTKDGATFEPPMNGEHWKLKKYFEEADQYIGKMLTVRFQGYTGKNKVPRFPKGRADLGAHSVRDYE